MEQKSDVKNRAEKLNKNSKGKFGLLIREVVSNAIHATSIRDANEGGHQYQPKVEVKIDWEEHRIKIEVKDNGEGFTELNSKYFTHLDTRNPEKESLNFHPMGQGRLAIVYFSDQAIYSSIYKKENGYMHKKFNYPEVSLPLFDIENIEEKATDKVDSETVLTINISSPQAYKRANTFFKKYSDIDQLKNWFIETFFPFFMEKDRLKLSVVLNNHSAEITKLYIENSIKSIPFSVKLEDEQDTRSEFTIWLVENNDKPKIKNQVTCFARHLCAEIEHGRIEYEIDLTNAYDWFLTAKYFDDNVDQKGEKIEISSQHIDKIQSSLTVALDEHFSSQIEINRTESKKNISAAEEKFPSLSLFMERTKADSTRKILKETELVSDAIAKKGTAEKNYWLSKDQETEEAKKLLNSSLHIYIDHRKMVLQKLKELINKFDDEGELKREPEDDIHDLFLRRGENLRTSDNKNHLHNLWILDDKYTIFSETFKSLSTRKGQRASDIYLWADDPERPKELLILELKSPSKAHNAGDKYESMVAQVKRYASDFYKNPVKLLNWDVDPDKILYFGIILARKSDVYKEIGSNNVSGKKYEIPFLDASYFFNDEFCTDDSGVTAPRFKEIRIEMYSYEDIFRLASSRNDVFLKLLKGEFCLDNEK